MLINVRVISGLGAVFEIVGRGAKALEVRAHEMAAITIKTGVKDFMLNRIRITELYKTNNANKEGVDSDNTTMDFSNCKVKIPTPHHHL
jgi:hypothetical protein